MKFKELLTDVGFSAIQAAMELAPDDADPKKEVTGKDREDYAVDQLDAIIHANPQYLELIAQFMGEARHNLIKDPAYRREFLKLFVRNLFWQYISRPDEVERRILARLEAEEAQKQAAQ